MRVRFVICPAQVTVAQHLAGKCQGGWYLRCRHSRLCWRNHETRHNLASQAHTSESRRCRLLTIGDSLKFYKVKGQAVDVQNTIKTKQLNCTCCCSSEERLALVR